MPRALLFAPLLALLASPQGGFNFRPELDAGHYLKVQAEANARLAANPSDPKALAAKSQALSSLMRFGEAESLANKALALDPGLADAWLSRGLARAGSAIQQRSFGSLRAAAGAMDDLRTATETDPSLEAAWMSLGLAYEQLPGLLGGSTRKALACADAVAKVNPVKGDLLRGTVLALDGRWNEGEAYLQRALTQAPGNTQVVSGYLSALGEKATRKALGERNQKARLVAEAWRLLPTVRSSGSGMEAVSLALLEGDQPEAAWKVALESLPGADAPSLLRLQLGKVAARSGLHRSEGLAFLDQVLREPLEGGSGGYPAAHWRRGQILRDLGRISEARQAAQAALDLDRRHRGALELLGELGK